MSTNILRITTTQLQDRIARTERMIADTEQFVRHLQASGDPPGESEKHQWEQLEKLRRELKELNSELSGLELV